MDKEELKIFEEVFRKVGGLDLEALDKQIAKEEETNSLESAKQEAIEKLQGTIKKTFDDGASKANVKEGSLPDAIKAGTQRAQDAIAKTFGSGEEMSR